MKITDRDCQVVSEIARWKYCLGRQIRILGGFTGQRATDRRLKILIDSLYIERHRIIYGVAGLYFVTKTGLSFFGIDTTPSKPRLDQIYHDIAVVDTAIYVMKSRNIKSSDIKTEKQYRKEQGFNPRKHLPDYIFIKDNKTYCVEVELSLKSKPRLEKNIAENYSNYDSQCFIVPRNRGIIKERVKDISKKYTDIELIDLEDIEQYVLGL